MFDEESYNRHGEWYNHQFPTEQCKAAYLKQNKDNGSKNSIGSWLQNIFFSCIDPLLEKDDQKWLTIGDAYGFDAQYILKKGNAAIASDLNTDFLRLAKREGIVEDFSSQNAERLSYQDCEFDYLLCKEAYHHFPKPYAALYEMIRVAKKGIILIEPQDPVSRMPLLLFFTNILSSAKGSLINKLWKNRFSYEPVGNFVYKISAREFEKFAAGLNLPLVAFKRINPNFYFKGADEIVCSLNNGRFRYVYLKKKMLDLLVRVRIIPSQVLAVVVFKQMPEQELLCRLKKVGYHLIYIPKNPYLKNEAR